MCEVEVCGEVFGVDVEVCDDLCDLCECVVC